MGSRAARACQAEPAATAPEVVTAENWLSKARLQFTKKLYSLNWRAASEESVVLADRAAREALVGKAVAAEGSAVVAEPLAQALKGLREVRDSPALTAIQERERPDHRYRRATGVLDLAGNSGFRAAAL